MPHFLKARRDTVIKVFGHYSQTLYILLHDS